MSGNSPVSPAPPRDSAISPVFDAYFVQQLCGWFSHHGGAWSGTPGELLKALNAALPGAALGRGCWPHDGSQLLEVVCRNSKRISRAGILLSVIERPGSPRFLSVSWTNGAPPRGRAVVPYEQEQSREMQPNRVNAGPPSGLEERSRVWKIPWRGKLTLQQRLTWLLACIALSLAGILAGMWLHDHPAVAALRPFPKPVLSRSFLPPASSSHSADAALQATLYDWLDSWKRRDLERQVAIYAPILDTYFTQHHVTRDKVHKDKEYSLWLYTRVRQYELSDLRIEWRSPQEAVATFRKKWDFAGRKKFSGDEIESLTLVNAGGKWLIKAERELKVFRRYKG